MAKSLRSKIKRRFKALKRKYYQQVEGDKKVTEQSEKQYKIIRNENYRTKEPENMFLKPNDPNAVVPQYVPQKHIDFRSSAIPFSGNEHRGGRRKKQTEVIQTNTDRMQQIQQQKLLQSQAMQQECDQQQPQSQLQQQQNDDQDDVMEFNEDNLEQIMGGMNIMSDNQKKKLKKKNCIDEEGVKKKITKSKLEKLKGKRRSCNKLKQVLQWK